MIPPLRIFIILWEFWWVVVGRYDLCEALTSHSRWDSCYFAAQLAVVILPGTFHSDLSFPPHQERIPYLSHTASKTSGALTIFLSTALPDPIPFVKPSLDDHMGQQGSQVPRVKTRRGRTLGAWEGSGAWGCQVSDFWSEGVGGAGEGFLLGRAWGRGRKTVLVSYETS